jgi:excisionase family DNA binding protein
MSHPTFAAVKKWFTLPEVAELLGIDDMKLHGWLKSGELVAVNVASKPNGRPRWRIAAESLQAFLEKRQSGPVPLAPSS